MFTSKIRATSTVANSHAYSIPMPVAGTAVQVIASTSTSATENDDNAADFITPTGSTYIADVTAGVNSFATNCWANAVAYPS